MSTLGTLLAELAARGPERPALTCAGRTLTFGELDDRSSQVAHALVRDGVRPGDRIAVLTKNRPEYFELMFGAARARAVLVGLNWRLAAPEIAAIADDAEPAAVFAGKDQRELLPPTLRDRAIDLDGGYEAWIADLPTAAPDTGARADDVVLQLYSSGTTGLPKGARLTSANLLYTPGWAGRPTGWARTA